MIFRLQLLGLVFVFVLFALLGDRVAKAGVFGVGFYLSGEPDADKVGVADSMTDLGISITRTHIPYGNNIDWTPYDTAMNLTKERGVDNLILLEIGSHPSVDDWGNFTETVASRYSGKTVAYEIFNEADDDLSGTDYAPYLIRSYDKIKAVDGNVKIIASGITGRTEAINFWNGIYNNGAWDKLDALGLHPYHYDKPEKVEFNAGSFKDTIEIAANYIRAKGGNKKIWITEFGLESSSVGEGNQANYLARSYILARAVPEVERVMIYRFRDNSGASWGMVNADLTHKRLYDLYKSFVRTFDLPDSPEELYILDKRTIENFDSNSGWDREETTNASVNLSNTGGLYGQSLKTDYNFSGGSGYVSLKKKTTLNDSPQGLGIWAKGTHSINVLKLRILDNNGETFQFDMGKVSSEWHFFRYDFSLDNAKTSWGGNGVIDYPISFDSIVYDNNGGPRSGSLYFDDLVAINGEADLYAYKSGSKLAYWKADGEAWATLCGLTLNFTVEPKISDVSSCSAWSSGEAVQAVAAPAPLESPAAAPAPTATTEPEESIASAPATTENEAATSEKKTEEPKPIEIAPPAISPVEIEETKTQQTTPQPTLPRQQSFWQTLAFWNTAAVLIIIIALTGLFVLRRRR